MILQMLFHGSALAQIIASLIVTPLPIPRLRVVRAVRKWFVCKQVSVVAALVSYHCTARLVYPALDLNRIGTQFD